MCSANSVNLPMMRRLELTDGIELTTEDGEFIGKSKTAAKQGISMVVLSRIGMVCQKKFNLDIAILTPLIHISRPLLVWLVFL